MSLFKFVKNGVTEDFILIGVLRLQTVVEVVGKAGGVGWRLRMSCLVFYRPVGHCFLLYPTI